MSSGPALVGLTMHSLSVAVKTRRFVFSFISKFARQHCYCIVFVEAIGSKPRGRNGFIPSSDIA